MIEKSNHYRVWDMDTNTVVLGFYDFPEKTSMENLIDTVKEFRARGKVISEGYYRIDRLIFEDGKARWQIGLAHEIH